LNSNKRVKIVFPNYAAKISNGSILLEASHPLLFDALTTELSGISVAAVVDVMDHPGVYRVVTNQGIQFIPLWEVGKKVQKGGKLIEYFGMFPKILRTVFKSEFCYIFAPGHVGLLACLSCLILKRPYALYLRGTWDVFTPSIFHWLNPIIFRKAKFVICTGNKLVKKIVVLNPHCEAVIPMSGMLLKEISPRTSYAITDKCRLLFVGQLARGKGIYELIEAMAMIGKSGYMNVDLTIIGTGIEYAQLQHCVNHYGLTERVRFQGFVDDEDQLATLFSNHDLFCLPTHYEGFPRVIYEAMLFGLPIITTKVGQIETLIHDNVNGLFVKVRSPGDLANKIVRLLENEVLRQRLGQQARATLEPMLHRWRESTHGHQVLRWMKETKVI